MDQGTSPDPGGSRRGCLIFAVLMALVLAALAFVGFNADPVDDQNASIPTVGGEASRG